MKRIVALTCVVLAIDQLTKSAAQVLLAGREPLIIGRWGVTYTVNRAFWLWPEASSEVVFVVHGAILGLAILPMTFAIWYRRRYRKSLAIDLFVAFFTTAATGNLIDRLLAGGARDWLVTPIAVANLADHAGGLALLALLWELCAHRAARRLLSIDPRRWWSPPA
jgi:lipoprotein signal peptidase